MVLLILGHKASIASTEMATVNYNTYFANQCTLRYKM